MVELSNRGNATVATMSCASTLFPASQIETFSTLGGPTDCSTRSKVSRSFRSIPHQNADPERSKGLASIAGKTWTSPSKLTSVR